MFVLFSIILLSFVNISNQISSHRTSIENSLKYCYKNPNLNKNIIDIKLIWLKQN